MIPNDIRVCGLGEVRTFIDRYDITKIVGLVAPGAIQPESVDEFYKHRDHMLLEFQDTDSEAFGGPSIEHVLAIIEYAKSFTEDDNVLFHCHAGISRSSAGAIIALVSRGMEQKEAMHLVRNIRGAASPNRLMMGHANNLFPGIYDTALEMFWHQSHKDRQMRIMGEMTEASKLQHEHAAKQSTSELERLLKIFE